MNEWIPVSVRLPDMSGVYLVTVSGNTDFCMWDNLKAQFGWLSRNQWYSNDEVTAWMQLPKPYLEED